METEPWVRFLARLGIQTTSGGGDSLLAMCVFHGDSGTPSLSVRSDGAFNCFGACSARGWGFVQLAMRSGLARKDAEALVEAYGLPDQADSGTPMRRTKMELPTILLGRYRVDWRKQWARWKGGAHPEEVKVGVAAAWMFETRAVSAEALDELKVGVDREDGYIVFPQMAADEEGRERCIGISKRDPSSKSFLNELSSKGKFFPMFRPLEDLILVEGQIDALRVRTVIPGKGTSTYGASVSTEHIDTLRSHKGRLVLFYDNDLAGMRTTSLILSEVGHWRCKVVTEFFDKKDPGDMTDGQVAYAVASAMDGSDVLEQGILRSRMHVLRGGQAA